MLSSYHARVGGWGAMSEDGGRACDVDVSGALALGGDVPAR